MNIWLSIEVVLPICIFILLGVLVKKLKWINDEGVSQSNRLIFRLFFPMLMFSNIYQADLSTSLNLPVIGFMLALTGVIFVLLMVLVPVFSKDRARQGSIIQGILRPNAMLYAIPIVSTIFAGENIGLVTMCVAVIAPVYNILTVIALESKRGEKVRFVPLLKSIVTNPIIDGAVVGILFKVFQLTLPTAILNVVTDMAQVVTPFSLILLGAGLTLGGFRSNKNSLAVVTICRLVLTPAFAIGIGYLLGFRDVALTTIFALSSVPTAVSSYVMAKEMGADAPLAGEIVATTSVLSILSIFLWMLLLTGIGWI